MDLEMEVTLGFLTLLLLFAPCLWASTAEHGCTPPWLTLTQQSFLDGPGDLGERPLTYSCLVMPPTSNNGSAQVQVSGSATLSYAVLNTSEATAAVAVASGSSLELRGIILLSALLRTMDRYAFQPAAFLLAPNASLLLVNSTVYTRCSTMNDYMQALADGRLSGVTYHTDNSSYIYVEAARSSRAQLRDTNITCDPWQDSQPGGLLPVAHDTASSTAELLLVIDTLSRVSSSDITLTNDVALTWWPTGGVHLQYQMSITGGVGLPNYSAAVLDLQQLPTVLAMDGMTTLTLTNLVIINPCALLFKSSLESFWSIGPLWAVSFNRASRLLNVVNSTIHVHPVELYNYVYYRLMYSAASMSWEATNISAGVRKRLLPELGVLGITRTSLTYMTQIALSTEWRNVTMTSEFPDLAKNRGFSPLPWRSCLDNSLMPALPPAAQLYPLYFVSDGPQMASTLREVAALYNGSSSSNSSSSLQGLGVPGEKGLPPPAVMLLLNDGIRLTDALLQALDVTQQPLQAVRSRKLVGSDEPWRTNAQGRPRTQLSRRFAQQQGGADDSRSGNTSNVSSGLYQMHTAAVDNTTRSGTPSCILPAHSPLVLQHHLYMVGQLDPNALTEPPETRGNPTSQTVDLSHLAGRVVLQGEGSVWIQRLTLINPANGCNTSLANVGRPANSSFNSTYSVGINVTLADSPLSMPFFAFNRSAVRVQLGSVTLPLHLLHFSIVYEMAEQGAAWRTLPTLAAAAEGLKRLDVVAFDTTWIHVRFFEGWGVNGTSLLLTLDMATGDGPIDVLPPDDLSSNADREDGGGGSGVTGWQVALIVVASVAAAGMLLTALLLLARSRRERAGLLPPRSTPTEHPGTGSLKDAYSHTTSHNNDHNSSSQQGNALNTNPSGSTTKDAPLHSSYGAGGRPELAEEYQRLVGVLKQAASQRTSQHSDPAAKGLVSPAVVAAAAADGSAQGRPGSGPNGPAASSGSSNQAVIVPADPVFEIRQLVAGLNPGDPEGLARLTILEQIGQGAYGTVYKGRWCNMDVAVKTVLFQDRQRSRPGGEGDDELDGAPGSGGDGADGKGPKKVTESRQRAILEAAVCASVDHPNVVTTYCYDVAPVRSAQAHRGLKGLQINDETSCDYKLYLIQEFCDASLSKVLQHRMLHDDQTGRPCLELILPLLIDISKGMLYIHSRNIIHGDLKPANVLMLERKDHTTGVIAKVTDFGLCAAMEPNQSHVSNFTKGTPYYVAPEVVTIQQVTKAADQWSYGVLMWELYTGTPPWLKTADGYTLRPEFGRFPEHTPRDYVRLAVRCMSQRPRDRPSFEEVLHELEGMYARVRGLVAEQWVIMQRMLHLQHLQQQQQQQAAAVAAARAAAGAGGYNGLLRVRGVSPAVAAGVVPNTSAVAGAGAASSMVPAPVPGPQVQARTAAGSMGGEEGLPEGELLGPGVPPVAAAMQQGLIEPPVSRDVWPPGSMQRLAAGAAALPAQQREQ